MNGLLAADGAGPASTPPADPALRALDPRVILLDRAVGLIATAIVAGATLVFTIIVQVVADDLALWGRVAIEVGWAAFVGLVAWHGYHWPTRTYAHTRYRVDDQSIEIWRGVYWREVVNVPRSRVQHTDVTQGPIDRRFGLGTLVIYTAGTDYARVELHGLEHGDALRIRTYLLPRATPDAV